MSTSYNFKIELISIYLSGCALLRKASKGDVRAITELANRIEGKVLSNNPCIANLTRLDGQTKTWA